MIILEVTKKQGFTLSSEDTFLEIQRVGGQIDPSSSRFRVKYDIIVYGVTMDFWKKSFIEPAEPKVVPID